MNPKHIPIVVVALASLVGCSRDPEPAIPEANNENCKPENIAKLQENIRVKFADSCFGRGSIKPSSGKTW